MAPLPRGSAWEPRVRSALDELIEHAGPATGRTGRRAPGELGNDRFVASMGRYLDLVEVWNARIDLTAARTPEELVDLFLADAFVLALGSAGLPDLPEAALTSSWVDVGAGAGAPGLVLSMLAPQARVTLVEPRSKRVAFLRTAIGTLGLDNAAVERRRSDELAGGGFQLAVSRATLPPEAWLVEGARLARAVVWVLLAHGEPPSKPGFRRALDLRYRWPLTGVSRRAVAFVRERPR